MKLSTSTNLVVSFTFYFLLCCLSDSPVVIAFSVHPSSSSSDSTSTSRPRSKERDTDVVKRHVATTATFFQDDIDDDDAPPNKEQQLSFLLEEFTTSDGELVQPYQLLGVSRQSSKIEIRNAYIRLSKMYHPDSVRNNNCDNNNKFPDGCLTAFDVRDQWERVKLSYEILSDRKTRLRYDRHESIAKALADPRKAMEYIAQEALNFGMKGLFEIGSFVSQQMVDFCRVGWFEFQQMLIDTTRVKTMKR